jgi:hypothetical protein
MPGLEPDPLDPSRIAEAIFAIERRVAVLEEKRRARIIEVKRPRLTTAAVLIAIVGFIFTAGSPNWSFFYFKFTGTSSSGARSLEHPRTTVHRWRRSCPRPCAPPLSVWKIHVIAERNTAAASAGVDIRN